MCGGGEGGARVPPANTLPPPLFPWGPKVRGERGWGALGGSGLSLPPMARRRASLRILPQTCRACGASTDGRPTRRAAPGGLREVAKNGPHIDGARGSPAIGISGNAE